MIQLRSQTILFNNSSDAYGKTGSLLKHFPQNFFFPNFFKAYFNAKSSWKILITISFIGNILQSISSFVRQFGNKVMIFFQFEKIFLFENKVLFNCFHNNFPFFYFSSDNFPNEPWCQLTASKANSLLLYGSSDVISKTNKVYSTAFTSFFLSIFSSSDRYIREVYPSSLPFYVTFSNQSLVHQKYFLKHDLVVWLATKECLSESSPNVWTSPLNWNKSKHTFPYFWVDKEMVFAIFFSFVWMFIVTSFVNFACSHKVEKLAV